MKQGGSKAEARRKQGGSKAEAKWKQSGSRKQSAPSSNNNRRRFDSSPSSTPLICILENICILTVVRLPPIPLPPPKEHPFPIAT